MKKLRAALGAMGLFFAGRVGAPVENGEEDETTTQEEEPTAIVPEVSICRLVCRWHHGRQVCRPLCLWRCPRSLATTPSGLNILLGGYT